MVMDAKNDDVVLLQKIALGLIQRVAADDALVVTIVPVGVFMRNDHVESGLCRALYHIEVAEHRGGNPLNLHVGSTDFKGIPGAGVAPRAPQIGFDSRDDLAGGESGHQAGLQ